MLDHYKLYACPIPDCPYISVGHRLTCEQHKRRYIEVHLQVTLRELEPGEEGWATKVCRKMGL